MTTITLDDELINQIIAKNPYKNANDAITNILFEYLQQSKKKTFFEQLCLEDNFYDDLNTFFERNKDTGRDIAL